MNRVAALWTEPWGRLTGTVEPRRSPSERRSRAEDNVGEEVDSDRDEIARAIRIGEENLEILRLAGDWCQNIDYTRGPFGVGLIEEQSGLPISGGSLRCDFANAPSIFGMQLQETAVGFYEENCIGCAERVATDAPEHLGTWADARIAERERLSQEAAQARQEAEEACSDRAAKRRILLGQADPSTQSILDLLDRVDSVDRDEEAEDLLVKHAEMAPSDFSDSLVEHMSAEAMGTANSAFLDAVFAVFERQERPPVGSVVDMAFRALGASIAVTSAGRILSTHAQDFDVDDKSLRGVVKLAAGRPDHIRERRVDSQPAALFRFFDCDPEGATKLLCGLLDDPDVWTRAYAGHATEVIVSARRPVGSLLLPSLLDSLRHADGSRYFGDPYAASQIANVVAEILVADPEHTDEQLSERIRSADPALSRRLWDCYESACRRRFCEDVPQDALDTIIRRSLILLESGIDADVKREIADNLSYMCGQHGLDVDWLIRELTRLLTQWAQRFRQTDTRELKREELTLDTFFEFEGERVLCMTIINRLQTALEAAAKGNPATYLADIESQWDSGDIRLARVWLLKVLEGIVQDQTTFDLSLPLLIRSLSGSSPAERAAALRVLGEIRTPAVSIPEDVAAQVIEALNDDHVVVLKAAIRASRCIEVPADRRSSVIQRMLLFIEVYAPKGLHTDDVHRAIEFALRMAEEGRTEGTVQGLVLELVAQLPSGEAGDLLKRLKLDHHPSWCGAAVAALGIDHRPEYVGLGDSTRKSILRSLATRSRTELAPFFSDLVDIALQRSTERPWWSGAIADLLAYHQEHELASVVSSRVVDAFPDTREQGPVRLQALQVAFGHQANAAATKGDFEAQAHIHEQWSRLLDATKMDEQRSGSER